MACRQPKPIEGVPLETLKQRAHARVRSQIKAGLLVAPTRCEQCAADPGIGKDGRRLLQAHHHNGYDRPLDVQWLCVQCHRDETPCNPRRGEEAVAAKLTEDNVRAIRSSPDRQFILARRYGVSSANIRQILKRKTWGHVEDATPSHLDSQTSGGG